MGKRIPELLGHAMSAADCVSAQICQSYPEVLARFGEQGRDACKESVVTLIAYIDQAVEENTSRPLAGYLRWLQEALRPVGLPGGALAESVQRVGKYFEGKLQAQENVLLSQVLAEGTGGLAKSAADIESPFLKNLPQPLPDAFVLADRLATGEVNAVRNIVERLHAAGATYLEIAVHLFQPALYRIGELWERRRISVAQEHLATAIVQNHLVLAYARSSCAPPTGHRALFACVQGNQHAVGLRMVADAFDLAGWEVRYLGADLPLSPLLDQVGAWRPQLLGLSVSLAPHVLTLKETIIALRGRFGRDAPKIMAGGLAINQVDGLWKMAGADLWAPSADLAAPSGAP